MTISLEKLINQKVEGVFEKLGLDKKFATVKVSDRPDLSDFQCNGALALAKIEKKNPREIATNIASILENAKDVYKEEPSLYIFSLIQLYTKYNITYFSNNINYTTSCFGTI